MSEEVGSVRIEGVPFMTTDWSAVPVTEHDDAEAHRSRTDGGARLFIVG